MHSELAGHDRERRALLVPCCGEGNRLIGHLEDHPPSSDTGLVEVVDHRRWVHSVSAGEHVDRATLSVPVDQLVDLRSGEPGLDRV